MSDAKSLLQQYLTNRRDELIDANRHDIANEFEIILEEFADFFSTPASGDYISKKALLEWLQNEADERKGIPLLHGNIQSYLRTKEFVESGRFDIPSPSEGAAEGRIPDGTVITRKDTGEEMVIETAIETNNQFGYGVYLYRFVGHTDTCFGLYRSEFKIKQSADGRYRERVKLLESFIEELSETTASDTIEEQCKNVLKESRALSPIGEQKEDTTCVMCRKREGVNLSTANRWYCEPCTDALPSADKEEEQK